jgi:hypothetical protein
MSNMVDLFGSWFAMKCWKSLSSIWSGCDIMNPGNRRDKSNNNNRTAKAVPAMPIAGVVVAALLLLAGLSVVGGSYHLVLAQQNMTEGGGGNATSAMNATTAGGGNQSTSELRLHLEEARTALQNNDIQGAMMHLDLAMNLLGGGTQGNMTSITGSTNSTA